MMSSCLYVIKCSYLPTVAMLICRFGVEYTDSLHNIQFESLLVLAFITYIQPSPQFSEPLALWLTFASLHLIHSIMYHLPAFASVFSLAMQYGTHFSFYQFAKLQAIL